MYPPHPSAHHQRPYTASSQSPQLRGTAMPAGPPGAPLSVLVACWVTPGLRVALLEGSTGSTCARPPVPGTMRWAVGLCSEAGAQGACGCTAWLPFETHSPACPLPPRWTWGFLLPCLCYDLEDGAVSESKPAWVSFLGEGVDFSGDSGSSPRGPQLLYQPPEIRCPTLCLSFGGTKETPSRVPRSPESNEFPGRRGTFSPLYLGNCHPTWATWALFTLSPAGFAFVTTMSTVSFLENAEG